MSRTRRPVVMPSVEVGMEDGRLLEYLVERGATVAVGDLLFTVEADKVTMDIESPAAGVVAELVAEPDSELPVGAEILILEVDE